MIDLAGVDRVSAELNRLAARAGWRAEILRTITSIESLALEPRACLFLIEGEAVSLVAQIGHDDTFRRLHEGLRTGDCLCGAVARTGQVITSMHCEKDCRHTITIPDAEPHGHVVVPLKAAGTLVGVLCLYLPPEREVPSSTIKTLTLIGEQLGPALHNEALQTRLESERLRDPRGLPSEHMLRVVGAQQLAEALRYDHPLSLLSVTPGVADTAAASSETARADAESLDALAVLVDRLTRKVDLVARCGMPPIDVIALLPQTPLDAAALAVGRIRDVAAEKAHTTLYVGVASLEIGMTSLDDLIERARANRLVL